MANRRDLKFYVDQLDIIESGEFEDQYLRPFQTSVKGDLIDSIEERLSSTRGRFTSSILSSIAYQFMVPDARPHGLIQVPNGWSERRGRFVMTVIIELPNGEKMMQMLIGYTSHTGWTRTAIDMDLEFYVNNSFMLRECTTRGRDGRIETLWVPMSPAEVLSDHHSTGLRGRGNKLYSMRPEDVFSAIDSEGLADLTDELTDLRTTLSRSVQTSRTSNRIAPRFMTDVLESRRKASSNNGEFGHTAQDLNSSAQGYVTELMAHQDLFLSAISDIVGDNRIVDNFQYRDLVDLDPHVDKVAEYNFLDAESKARTDYRNGHYDPNDGQEEEDRIAALIAYAIPALALECGIARCHVSATSMDRFEPLVVFLTDARSFARDIDMTEFILRMEERTKDELLAAISENGRIPVEFKAMCWVNGDIEITLNWDNRPTLRKVFPCFMNSKSSPIITDSQDDLRHMARDFASLFNTFMDDEVSNRMEDIRFDGI